MPAAARLLIAKGLAPMTPSDLMTAQFVLAFDADAEIRQTARGALAGIDRSALAGAGIHSEAIDQL